MAKLFNRLFGCFTPDAMSTPDAPAPATPPALIEGAHNARELVMLPVDDAPSVWAKQQRGMTPGKRLIQFKGDGIRALYVDGRIVSREGAPLDCALHCQPALARMEQLWGGGLVVDGEYIAEDGFDATLQEHKRGEGQGVFWAFDMLPLADWRAGRCEVAVEKRVEALRELVEADHSRFLGMFGARILSQADATAWAREIWDAGGEGIVSKRLGSAYVRARRDDWVRVKQVHTVDAIIVDVAARPDGTLKRMVVKPIDAEGAASVQPVVIGTGWSEQVGRNLVLQFTAGHDSWAEISFQLSTGARRSVRGARFHRIRMAKGAEA